MAVKVTGHDEKWDEIRENTLDKSVRMINNPLRYNSFIVIEHMLMRSILSGKRLKGISIRIIIAYRPDRFDRNSHNLQSPRRVISPLVQDAVDDSIDFTQSILLYIRLHEAYFIRFARLTNCTPKKNDDLHLCTMRIICSSLKIWK